MVKGHILSTFWDLARASVFWTLHWGHAALPGRPTAIAYRTYRTEATLLCSRGHSACESNPSLANTPCSEKRTP
eukprot:3620865-Pleurochrysis_carterae.AAC.1